ncbi:MAG TPA: GNAT family N-acetyltransferase [Terriglobales bacterium]|nr:GNAT family N-acetyltransferase [Terriglobales bacterium]
MLIREMKKEDIEQSIELSRTVREKTWETYEKEVYPRKLLDEELQLYSYDTFLRFIGDENKYSFVAEENGKIIGLAIGRFDQGGISDLSWICTDLKEQGKGIGKKLIDKIVDYSKEKGCHKLFAYTTPNLLSAVKLYLSTGFVQEAHLRKHWHKLDFLIMSKWLE